MQMNYKAEDLQQIWFVAGASAKVVQILPETTSLTAENTTRLEEINVVQGSPFFEKLIQYNRLDY